MVVHPGPYTLNLESYTQPIAPHIINRKPYIQDMTPSALNLELYTFKPHTFHLAFYTPLLCQEKARSTDLRCQACRAYVAKRKACLADGLSDADAKQQARVAYKAVTAAARAAMA